MNLVAALEAFATHILCLGIFFLTLQIFCLFVVVSGFIFYEVFVFTDLSVAVSVCVSCDSSFALFFLL